MSLPDGPGRGVDVTAPLPAFTVRERVVGFVRALRVHQWAKNALVFLPAIGAHRIGDRTVVGRCAVAFVAFGLVASATYVLNDIIDVESDRRHPRKRLRPFAAGTLPVEAGYVAVPVLLATGAVFALALPIEFALLLAAYFTTTLAYSLWLKRLVAADVVVLAGLYTSRVFAGGLATGVPVSEWLATFSVFLFLSLALLKRASDLIDIQEGLPGREYGPLDRSTLVALGIAAGYLSVLVLVLYLASPEVRRLYSRPLMLWALCPLVLYWLTRLWILGRRGEFRGDPFLFALRDPISWGVAVLGALVIRLGI